MTSEYLNVFIDLSITLLIKFISPDISSMLVPDFSGRLVKLHTLEKTWNVMCQSSIQVVDLEIRQDIGGFLSFQVVDLEIREDIGGFFIFFVVLSVSTSISSSWLKRIPVMLEFAFTLQGFNHSGRQFRLFTLICL